MTMRKKLLSVSMLSMMAFTGMAFAGAQVAKAQSAGGVIKPASDWAVSKIATAGAEPYCTLVREYDGGIALTLGQNMSGEYSIAIDFQKPKFDPEKAYEVTLQPGPGQLRAYEMMPASIGAMVVRLGFDDTFLAALSDSSMLTAGIDEEEFNFSFPNFASGEQDLSACMAGLKGGKIDDIQIAEVQAPRAVLEPIEEKLEIPEPVAPAKAQVTSNNFSAKKIETPEAVMPSDKPSRIASVLGAAKNAVTGTASSAVSAVSSVAPSAPVIASSGVDTSALAAELSSAKSAASRAQRALDQAQAEKSRIASELASAQSSTQSLNSQIESLRAEKQMLQSKISEQASSTGAASTEAAQMAAELARLTAENEAVQSQYKSLQDTLMKKEASIADLNAQIAAAANASATAAAGDSEALIATKAQLSAAQKELGDIKATQEKAISEAVNEAVKNAVAEKEKQMIAAQASTQSEQVATLNARIAALELENKKFYEDAKQARGQIDTAKVEIANDTFKRVRELQRKLDAAAADNLTLTKQLEELTRNQDDIALGLAKGDWTLEKATRRYNEAEKEVRRLGALLEQQRVSCRAEAEELEQMLFDPTVASEAQRKKLVRLEKELSLAQEKMAKRSDISPEQFANVKAELDQAKAALKAEQQKESMQVAQLNEQLNAAKSALNARQTQTSANAAQVSALQAELSSMKSKMQAMEVQYKKLQEQKREPLRVAAVNPTPKVVAPSAPSASSISRASIAPAARIASIERAPIKRTQAKPEFKKSERVMPNNRAASTPPASSSDALNSVVQKAAAPKPATLSVSKAQIQGMLKRAGIGAGALTSAGDNLYKWRAQNTSGFAQVIPKSQAGDVVQYAQKYIIKQRTRCKGDFASVPGATSRGKATYEIACVGGNTSTSSSLLFFEDKDSIAVIAHETSADDMDIAMDMRDKVAAQIN